MTLPESTLQEEVSRFLDWADQYPIAARNDWWAEEYPEWPKLDEAVLNLMEQPSSLWSQETIADVLYVIARDDERRYIVSALSQRAPEILPFLTAAAFSEDNYEAKWQLAAELGQAHLPLADAEALLLALSKDDDEYVQRHALVALAKRKSSHTENVAVAIWDQEQEGQEWARMAVLESLHRINSPLLRELLTEAESDERPYLSEYAKQLWKELFAHG